MKSDVDAPPPSAPAPTDAAGRVPSRTRRNDPERTRADILAVATEEFARHGLSGARVDAIAERTRTSKRMIYYYFGSKEGLYLAVLERAYQAIRDTEAGLNLQDLPPAEAIRRIVELTFDYDEANPDFVRLVTIENIHQAEHMRRSASIRSLNVSVIEALEQILARGRRQGVFTAEIDAVDLHMMISALCFFRVSNRYTFGTIFRRDLSDPAIRAQHRRLVGDAILRFLGAGTGD